MLDITSRVYCPWIVHDHSQFIKGTTFCSCLSERSLSMIRFHMLVGNNKEEARSGWKRDNDAIDALGNVMRLEVCVS